jgi:lysozyme
MAEVTMLRGVDVSFLQGSIDWKVVAAEGLRFAIIKGAEGNKPAVDSCFTANVLGVKAAGLTPGAYNFAYPLPHIDPAQNAKDHFNLTGNLGSSPDELPPTLDLEWPPPGEWQKWNCTAKQIRAWALAYLDTAASLWGCIPTLYTYPDFWMRVGGSSEPTFANYSLWIASYQHPHEWPDDTMKPFVFAPWGTNWRLWQSSGGNFFRLPNGTPCDTDLFNGDDTALATFCARTLV